MAGIKSREQRERERRRKAKINRTQLLGATQQGGQRRPMQQGYTTTTVKPPQFQKPYDAGADITQAGLAFKGGRGVYDFATGKEAYTDAAGKFHKAREPWSLGDKSISDRLSQYGTDVSDRFTNTGRDLGNLFGTPTPQPGRVPAAGGGFFGSTTPTSPASGYGHAVPGSSSALQAARYANTPALQTMNKFNLGGDISGPATGLYTQQGILGGPAGGMSGMSGFGGGAGAGGNLLGGTSSAFAGANAAGEAASAINAAQAASTTAEVGSGLQGADAAASAGSGGSGHPWLAYANIGKDLIMGGEGSEKITGSTAGDAIIRAAAAYYTFGFSELAYSLF